MIGCVLLVISTVIPVMKWPVNAKHASAGNARVWLGDGWTLADGGFGGAQLLPVAAAAAVVLAVAVLVPRVLWRVRATLVVVAGYVPLWVGYVFVRKQEDGVNPAFGVVVLAIACLCLATGLWLGRPASSLGVKGNAPESVSSPT